MSRLLALWVSSDLGDFTIGHVVDGRRAVVV